MYVSWGFFLVKINLLSILVHSWNIHFTLLLSSISETAIIPNGSNYSALLDSDRRLRDFEILEQWRMPGDTDSLSPDIAMYRWLALSVKETGKTLWLILSLFEDVFHSFDKSASRIFRTSTARGAYRSPTTSISAFGCGNISLFMAAYSWSDNDLDSHPEISSSSQHCVVSRSLCCSMSTYL